MNLKQEAVAGKCRANRCKVDAQESADNPYGLCNQHSNEWIVLGKSELKPTAPRKPKSDAPATSDALEVIRAEIAPVRTNLEAILGFAVQVPLDCQHVNGIGLGSYLGRPDRDGMTGLDALGMVREMARQQIQMLEEKRTSVTKPMLDTKRTVDSWFRPATEQCEAIMNACTDRLNSYERERLAMQRAAAVQVRAAPDDPSVLAVAHHTTAPLPQEVETRTRFVVRVIDFAKVPPEFLLFNQQLADSYVSHKRGQCTIPGCEITEEPYVVASGRTA